MPQSSTLYAVARFKMRRRHFLSSAQMQRLLSAPDYLQARLVLLEAGYLDSQQADWETAAAKRLQSANDLLRKLTPDAALSDAFMLRHDIHNLKTLFKARILGMEPEGISSCGTLDTELLRHAVADHRYRQLPPVLGRTMDVLEKQTALKVDPMAIDVLLDQAMFTLMHQALSRGSSPAAWAWLRMKADFANLAAFVRLHHMTSSLSFEEVLVAGGSIDTARLQALKGRPEILLGLYQVSYGRKISALARAALEDRERTSALERELDSSLRTPFAGARLKTDSMDAILAYMLDIEQETAAVRLIMTGKRNGLSQEAIEERLRAGYGG